MNIHPTAIIGEPAQWRGREHEEQLPPEIHPTATVGAYTCVDAGVERPTRVGAHTLVMKQVHVGHGVQIGVGCDIATGTVLGGEVTVGDFTRIGIGVAIRPWVKVGSRVRIGSGSVVLHDVPDGTVVAGNPARHIRELNEAEIHWLTQRVLESTVEEGVIA